MIDIIGAITLTALFALMTGILIAASRAESAIRSRLVLASIIWFAAIASLGAAGVFTAPGAGTAIIGLAVLTPVLLSIVAFRRWPALRRIALETPLPLLVGLHAGRVLGLFFLVLLAEGRLPPTFAMAAGWGDIAVGIAAVPVAWAIHQRAGGWRALALVWNAAGFADLLTAVTLGVGSAAGSPARFIFEPNSGAIALLPWVLIPAVLVPSYLVIHLAIFAQLTRASARHTNQRRNLAWQGAAR